ncbi:hypothetical protein ATE84_4940 [Aquimarina sp. MAR_2010_214]|uniref:hypothetical protein n=1 Tax=Aquimarina sp. MAR_2010_214 TaxID=1250026 RepID=UPI000C702A22|nr:hypothetical protein [Aquimarina sp. MAR_2010_214]PKV52813.1 hypothetical protein ATE84_4940 [Aquimarina sp. MAR_2010_214]
MNYWINIYTAPENYAMDDAIADAGRQWTPDPKDIHILHITKNSHGRAKPMFNEVLAKKTISASSLLLNSITNYIETK